MFTLLEELSHYKLRTKDEIFRSPQDFLFDDVTWGLRYIQVNDGKFGDKLLIPRQHIGMPDLEKREIPINLTSSQIKEGPKLEEHAPVSKQHEKEIHNHFDLQLYWASKSGWPFTGVPENSFEVRSDNDDHHLRSVKEIQNYKIYSEDEKIGYVSDFLCDDQLCIIRYLKIETGLDYLKIKPIILAPVWISDISWENKTMTIDISNKLIKKSPTFDKEKLHPEYEKELHIHYGFKGYWE